MHPLPHPPTQIIRRNLRLLSLSQALFTCVLQLIPVLGALIVFRMTHSPALAGAAASVSWGGRIVLVYQSGKMMDRFGRIPVLMLGTILSIAGSLAIGVTTLYNSFPGLIVALAVFGLGVGVLGQARIAAADMYPPNQRAEAVGYLLTANVIGSLVAPVFITGANWVAAANAWDAYATPWFLSIVILGMTLLTLNQVRPDPQEIASHLEDYYGPLANSHPVNPIPSNTVVSFTYYPLLTAFIVAALTQGNMTMLMALASLGLEAHGVSVPLISLAITVHVIGMFGFAVPLGRFSDRLGRKKILVAGAALSGLGALLTPLVTDFWTVSFAIFLVGLGWSAATVSTTALISDITTPFERGRAIGANDFASSATALTFPLFGGLLIGLFGYASLGIFGLIASVPPLFAAILLHEVRPGIYAHRR